MDSRTCFGAGVARMMTWPIGWELRSSSSPDTQQTLPGMWLILDQSTLHNFFSPGTRCWSMRKIKPILSDLSISILGPRGWERMVTTAWNTRKWSLSWSPCTPGCWWTCPGWKPSRGLRSWGLNLYLSLRSIQRRRCRANFTLWCKTRDLPARLIPYSVRLALNIKEKEKFQLGKSGNVKLVWRWSYSRNAPTPQSIGQCSKKRFLCSKERKGTSKKLRRWREEVKRLSMSERLV